MRLKENRVIEQIGEAEIELDGGGLHQAGEQR
jgi:hypothetical protein